MLLTTINRFDNRLKWQHRRVSWRCGLWRVTFNSSSIDMADGDTFCSAYVCILILLMAFLFLCNLLFQGIFLVLEGSFLLQRALFHVWGFLLRKMINKSNSTMSTGQAKVSKSSIMQLLLSIDLCTSNRYTNKHTRSRHWHVHTESKDWFTLSLPVIRCDQKCM